MLKSLTLVLGAVLLLTACAISRETYLADGRKGYSISCDGAAVGVNVCFEKAGKICKERGYDLVARNGQTIPMAVAHANGVNSYVHYGAFNTKSIMIACR